MFLTSWLNRFVSGYQALKSTKPQQKAKGSFVLPLVSVAPQNQKPTVIKIADAPELQRPDVAPWDPILDLIAKEKEAALMAMERLRIIREHEQLSRAIASGKELSAKAKASERSQADKALASEQSQMQSAIASKHVQHQPVAHLKEDDLTR